MNDTVKRVLVLADEFALRGYHHDDPDSREAARQALHDELTRLFTPLSDEQIQQAISPLYRDKRIVALAVDESIDEYRAIEAAHGITGEKK